MKRTKKMPPKPLSRKTTKKNGPKSKKPASAKIEEVQRLVELLQINQIELEHQNQELRIAEEDLEISRNRYVNLFDFAPIPYFTLDADGTMKEVNLSASAMFGIERSKLIGKRLSTYITPEGKEIFSSFVKTVFRLPVKHSCTLQMINKEKRVFLVRMEGIVLVDVMESEQKCHIALIDLTEHNTALE